MTIEVKALGRLEVLAEGARVELGPHRQRALFALLLIHNGRVLSTDRILDELWGPDLAADRHNTLWVYVSGLRSALEPDRAKRSEGTVLLTRPPGYLLDVPPDAVDVAAFERMVAEGRSALAVDPLAASTTLSKALESWRGHAYEEFTFEKWAEPEISRLEELRTQALESRIEADLALGLGVELVPELEAVARLHPLRETPTIQLMRALQRAGRTPEALRVARAFAARLGEELGLNPSPEFSALEERIITGEPMPARQVAGGPRPGPAVRGYEIRDRIGDGRHGVVYRAYQPTVGREVAIKVVPPELADDAGFIRRFEAAAKLIARIEHPNVVPVYDFWREPGAAYLVMRLMTGGVPDPASLDRPAAVRILEQVASALDAAHDLGVIHGNLTLSSVLLDAASDAHLTDFGAVDDAAQHDDRVAFAALAHQLLGGLPTDAALSDVDSYPDLTSLTATVVGALGLDTTAPPPTRGPNPYKGLRPFEPADAGDFHGRRRMVERLLSRLGNSGPAGRFVAVVGPSGSGKSSVVMAGLLPALDAGALPGSADWKRVVMTPGRHPFEKLESSLWITGTGPHTSLLDVMAAPNGMARAVRQVTGDDGSQLLVVVDQFEELFTQTKPETATAFLDRLAELIQDNQAPVKVVVTLRADFYDRPLTHRTFGEIIRLGTEAVTPLTVQELEEVIVAPAARRGVDFDRSIVSQLIHETVDQAAALPLLQFALAEMWDSTSGPRIGVDAYRAAGGVSGALVRRADAIHASLPTGAASTARQVFLRLVSLGEEGARDTRRRVLRSELDGLGDPADVSAVVDTFGRHRLLSFDHDPVSRGPTVEIAHEALLGAWVTVAGWVADARSDVRAQRRLAAAMNEWEAAKRDDSFLLREGTLDRLRAWEASTTFRLSAAERSFLERSLEADRDDKSRQEEREVRARHAEERATKRTRLLAGVLAVAASLAGVTFYAFDQRASAVEAREDLAAREEALRIANVAATALLQDPELSILLAIEAVRTTADRGYAVPDAIDALHWGLQQAGVQYDVDGNTRTAIRPGPDGSRGVWVVPIDELVDLGQQAIDREMTESECVAFLQRPCQSTQWVPPRGIDYLGGAELYASLPASAPVDVRLMGVLWGADSEQFIAELERAASELGIGVRHTSVALNVSAFDASVDDTQAAIHLVSQPGVISDIAGARRVLDVSEIVDESTLRADYGDHLVDIASVQGQEGRYVGGLLIRAELKSMFWYRPDLFDRWDGTVPANWEELLAVADRIVAAGGTPFCIGFDPDASYAGWPMTDWVESALLSAEGPVVYADWVSHRIPFDDPRVVAAIGRVGRLIVTDGYVAGRRTKAVLPDFGIAFERMAFDSETCAMSPTASFVPASFGLLGDPTSGLDVFGFPAISADYQTARVGGGVFAIAVSDRPEVRALMAAMASPSWGMVTAEVENPLILPANLRFPADTFADVGVARVVSDIQAAVASGQFVFDGSDTMPGGIGDAEGAFLEGMVRLVTEGTPENLEDLSLEIAREIEAAWVELEREG